MISVVVISAVVISAVKVVVVKVVVVKVVVVKGVNVISAVKVDRTAHVMVILLLKGRLLVVKDLKKILTLVVKDLNPCGKRS